MGERNTEGVLEAWKETWKEWAVPRGAWREEVAERVDGAAGTAGLGKISNWNGDRWTGDDQVARGSPDGGCGAGAS